MTRRRAVALTVLSPATPAISGGKPSVPAYWAHLDSTVTLIQGPKNIHAIKDPNPKWDPRTGGWFHPPPPVSVPFGALWTVDSLPDPGAFPGGYYWLGDASSADGTAGINTHARQWLPHGATPGAPAWHSFFPFKPSVRAHDSFLPGGNVVHHPKGVHLNSHYIEHMWADFGRDRRQPFTWVIVAMVASYPHPNYNHFILDAGRNPDAVHFPRLSAGAVNTGRGINDGLNYRSLLSFSPHAGAMTAQPTAGGVVRMRADAGLRPKMFFGVFNGAKSYMGAYDPGGKREGHGHLGNTIHQKHRYYVLGRRQGHISQDYSSHLLIFEIRYWSKALTHKEIKAQYHQLGLSLIHI